MGLGSNVGDRLANLTRAVILLDELESARVEAGSPIYETEPVGDFPDQRDFFNAVVRVSTSLSPPELLDACKAIERDLGRVAGPHHGPRPIDIDLLLGEDGPFESERLRLPHPAVMTRRFVLVPLLEVDPPGRDDLERALQALPPGQRVDRVGTLIA